MLAPSLLCQRCHAGEMEEYQRSVGKQGREVVIRGSACARCGYVELENDEAIWSSIGL